MHHQNNQCHPGHRHLYNREHVRISLYQPVHQAIELNGSLAQQDNGKEGIGEAQQYDGEGGSERPVPIPVRVTIYLVVLC